MSSAALTMGAMGFSASSYARILGANDRVHLGRRCDHRQGFVDVEGRVEEVGVQLGIAVHSAVVAR